MIRLVAKKRTIWKVATAATVFALCLCAMAAAQEDGVPLNINPVPSFDSGETDIEGAADRYFKVQGTVEAVEDDYIVVNDTALELAPGAGVSRFFVGKYVGVGQDAAGRVLYVQLIRKPQK